MSAQPCAAAPAYAFVNETQAHAVEIDGLLNRAFGPGRFAKVSERVREFADFAPELSFCALDAGRVVGSVRMWRVSVGGRPIVFLGPLAVEESERKHGLGAQLVDRACAAAKAAGEAAVVLVGDLPFFGRVGFEVVPDVILPGPVDPRRVLARRFEASPLSGAVGPR
ncbi:MAG: N-acetyltransferase [Caulobacterales bacterium]|nr:N-acetyltransferase [Caulobacterales bacterium]